MSAASFPPSPRKGEQPKVWLITSGSYSDYSIDCAFSTKEKAETFLREARERDDGAYSHFRESDCGIEEHVLDVVVEESGAYKCRIEADGTVEKTEWFWLEYSSYETVPKDAILDHEKKHDKVLRDGVPCYAIAEVPYFMGYGRTKEHARRNAEEFRRVYVVTHGLPVTKFTYNPLKGHELERWKRDNPEPIPPTTMAFFRKHELHGQPFNAALTFTAFVIKGDTDE